MNIGIDIDNVLSNFNEVLLNDYTKHDKELRNNGIVNNDVYIRKMFDWSEDEEALYYKENIERLASLFEPIKDCSKYIKKLRENGHCIYIISGRDNGEYSDPYNMTIKWLKKYDIEYDKLILTNAYNHQEKADICIKNNVDIMIDDSIVRGTTCARIVRLLREAGAKEVHMRVSSPAFRYPCYFGTDVDSQENLIACQYSTVEEIAQQIGVDSLAYLSVEATHRLAEKADICFCDGCFTGNYPIEVPKEQPKDKFENKLNQFSSYYQVLD